MPRRRPPREGHAVNNLILLAAAIFLLPWLVDAQQQPRLAVQQRHKSPHEALEVTKIPHRVDTHPSHERRKRTLSVEGNDRIDASAIATLAPAGKAVAAPPTRQSSVTAGLSSPHLARSLEDWEVEDIVLLATIDGKLNARDRKTGETIWELLSAKPMVETIYHQRNKSIAKEDIGSFSIDEYLWIVEPSRDGSLYIYRPDGPKPGLVNTGLTMKKLVEEMAPHAGEDPPVTYTGEKKTTMYTVDANTGKIQASFGARGAEVFDCKPSSNRFDNAECPQATLTIGRTEYTVGIQGRRDGRHIATLTYSEWTPNNYDHDLQSQYSKTLDGKYIYSTHDGGVLGLAYDNFSPAEPRHLFRQKLSSSVVRVFDVARPFGDTNSPELILLPQPMLPSNEDETSRHSGSIFLNHTEDGSWYAMSGKTYPGAVQKNIQQARCDQQEWVARHPRWDITNKMQLSEALVGVHSIERASPERLLTIAAPKMEENNSVDRFEDRAPAVLDDPTIAQTLHSFPRLMTAYLLELIKNPILLLILGGLVFANQREIRSKIGHFCGDKGTMRSIFKAATAEKDFPPLVKPLPEVADKTPGEVVAVEITPSPGQSSTEETETPSVIAASEEAMDTAKLEVPNETKPTGSPEKKKAHRGRRGGQRHKKGPRAKSQGLSEDSTTPAQAQTKAGPTVEDAVEHAKNMGQDPPLEPDVRTMPSDPQEVSGPIIRIGALEVNSDKLIGTGSNGTMVFEGKFDGREVAVKRMLIQFFDIASQETRLLRESDDHPNVIRYFAQQQAAGFLYIALELCPASLADVIDKPHNHRELAIAGEMDLPNVLYQITNGLQHLHKLRIVHRDLKPQNILVAMGKDGRPRLLVSDFGLCKKLEGEQSSFRATTAHAAGTSGWRAPELLVDDDVKDGRALHQMVDATSDHNSGSIVLGGDILPSRRATRAIDIFSLGLVFFYVLTKGSHPFDCGDRFMREPNIRKGTFDLGLLDVLGDYSYEAKDLIASMLSAEPKQRPQAHQVMAHPFFWSAKKRLNFLCDVSDHFEKEKRDPPSSPLQELEGWASSVCGSDFLKPLGKEFVDSLGKQRKYTGTRLLDLLRALRNKKNHYEDMSDKLKEHVGPLPDGYLSFWTRRFPNLLITCWNVVYEVQWEDTDRFKDYYLPAGL